MNWWTAAIYGIAAVAALQGLFALMTAHRQAALRRCFEEEMQQREEVARHSHENPSQEATSGRTKAA